MYPSQQSINIVPFVTKQGIKKYQEDYRKYIDKQIERSFHLKIELSPSTAEAIRRARMKEHTAQDS
jgi:hypothetical protein